MYFSRQKVTVSGNAAASIFRIEVKMEVEGSSKALVTIYQITRCHNAEDYNRNTCRVLENTC
jgi:hypothetical protein